MGATKILELVEKDRKAALPMTEEPAEKPSAKLPKGETRRISLQQFREGKRPAEIAQERGLALTTIEAHLVSFISSGELEAKDLEPENKLEVSFKVIEKLQAASMYSTP